jgi:hypothetical protein
MFVNVIFLLFFFFFLAYKQQIFISHVFGDWKAQTQSLVIAHSWFKWKQKSSFHGYLKCSTELNHGLLCSSAYREPVVVFSDPITM